MMINGYERTYETIVHKLADCDFDETAARLGLDPPVDGTIKVNFLGREYKISPTGIIASDGMPSDPNARSTLIYYTTSKGSGEPSYSYRLLHCFVPGAIVGNEIAWITAPLVHRFENDCAEFDNILRTLEATRKEPPRKGEHIWSYRILPKIPMQIIYMEADDEFPCEIKLMLDSHADRFLEFEQLAFLCGCLVQTISKSGKTNL